MERDFEVDDDTRYFTELLITLLEKSVKIQEKWMEKKGRRGTEAKETNKRNYGKEKKKKQ